MPASSVKLHLSESGLRQRGAGVGSRAVDLRHPCTGGIIPLALIRTAGIRPVDDVISAGHILRHIYIQACAFGHFEPCRHCAELKSDIRHIFAGGQLERATVDLERIPVGREQVICQRTVIIHIGLIGDLIPDAGIVGTGRERRCADGVRRDAVHARRNCPAAHSSYLRCL